MKSVNNQSITTEVQNLNEVLRLQRMLAKEFRNPEVSFLNPTTFSIKLDSDFFFTLKMNEEKEYQVDAIYHGEDRVDSDSDEWMNLMHFLTEVDKIRSRAQR